MPPLSALPPPSPPPNHQEGAISAPGRRSGRLWCPKRLRVHSATWAERDHILLAYSPDHTDAKVCQVLVGKR